MLAFVFPGQGAQTVGMARSLAEGSAAARSALDEAGAVLGADFVRLIDEGPAEDLQHTENAQPAIVAVSVAALRALQERVEVTPAVAAGHSLGEYAALVATGALSFAEALKAVRARGRAMQTAVPVGEGTMAAVIGLAAPRVTEVVREVDTSDARVAVAGYNSPEQTTISGHAAAVERAGEALKEAGAKRVLPLKVSAPFHCPLMAPVETPLREALQEVTWGQFAAPVISNVEAEPHGTTSRSVELLVQQLTAPVRWVESVQAMIAMGVEHFVELGPGRSLSGMIRKIDRAQSTLAVGDGESLEKAAAVLG